MSTLVITGGTGSFGQAMARRALDSMQYSRVVIYSRDEQKQEKMRLSMADPNQQLRFFIGDVRDKDRLAIALHGATTIIHAAALKIVPAGEYNPFEFVKTNTIGTQNVLECAPRTPCCQVIMLSTDKAVAPINLYGATKLAAEKLTLAYNNVHGQHGPRCCVVRYGNVANSNGSVIPLFVSQYKAGKPFTITDWDMTRYWITLEEAVDFVWSKLTDYTSAPSGQVYIPSMPSFKLSELTMAITDGVPPRIRKIGLRPGEKLHETMDGKISSNMNTVWLDRKEIRSQILGLGYQLEKSRYDKGRKKKTAPATY